MTTLIERMKNWNEHANGLPRKGLLIAFTLLLTWLFILIVPLCWPFILALLFSMMLLPLIRLCQTKLARLHIPRWLVTLIGMLLLFGVLGVGFVFLFNRLFHEFIALVRSAPEFVDWISNTVFPYVRDLYQQYSNVLPASTIDIINKALSSLSDAALGAAGNVSAALTSGAVNAATSIPGVLLSVVLTIMGTFYFTADRERITTFLKRTFPQNMQKHGLLVKNNLFKSLFGQIKSQLTVSLIIMTFLTLAFVIYGIQYGLLMGVLIGLADALPVIGAGLFLLPWGAFELILGHIPTGIFLLGTYIGTVVIRQIFEPRIVGANLGLYPLATMMAMFAGFQLVGVLGLIIGPVLLNLLKVVLEADEISRGVMNEPPKRTINLKKIKLKAKE